MAVIFHFKCTFNLDQSKILSSGNELNVLTVREKSFEKIAGKGENARSQHFLLLSSPEHKVLMVSFCDRPMSGVRRPSCVVHNFFKHLLLLNQWANLDETWQGCSLGEALPKLFKKLNSNHNSGCHGNQKEKNSKIFENLLL